MKKTIFATLIFTFLFSLLFFSAQVHAQDIPTIVPYVSDFANVINSSYESMINNYAAQLESATTAEIAVLIVNSTQPMPIEEYAVKVFEKNGIGQKGIDNGILIVAAISDRRWKIEVGYGLEGDINDAKAGRIGRAYMTSYFQDEKYGEGLYLTVKTLADIIAGNETLSGEFEPDGLDELWFDYSYLLLFMLAIFILPPIIISVKNHICPKCHSWMRVERKGNMICHICKKCGYKKCVKKKRRRCYPFFIFLAGGGRGRGGGGGGFGGGGFGGGGSGGGGAGGGW